MKLTLLTATRRPDFGLTDFPPEQPGWVDVPAGSDDLDVPASGTGQVAAQLRGVPGRAAHLRAGDVHGHEPGHEAAP